LLASSGWSAEVTPPAQSSEANLKAKLDRIFAGEAPSGLDDLRLMQEHVKQLSNKLLPTTVGVRIGEAWGSGVIISKDGYVLTAAHVAGKPNLEAHFVMSDGRILKGKTLGLNRTIDAGMMKITDGGEFPFVELGASERLKEGQWCLALGHPGGFNKQRGIVVRLGRVIYADEQAITSDCTLVGGDSGGPLFDMQGRVIGINSRIAGALTANLHVPVDTFRDTWDRLVKSEVWGHFPGQEPVLGVRGDDSSQARIARVVEGTAAEKAGLKVGDVITRIDNQEIREFKELQAAVMEHQPNDRIVLRVQRGEQLVDVTVVLGRRPQSKDD
jgi:serine protease Do